MARATPRAQHTPYEKLDGNVYHVSFGKNNHKIDCRDRLATAIFTQIASDIADVEKVSIRTSIDTALRSISRDTSAPKVKAAINRQVATDLARANCLKNSQALLLPSKWLENQQIIDEQRRGIQSNVRATYRGALVALIDPETSITNAPLFRSALNGLNDDWNSIRRTVTSTTLFTRIEAYLGTEIATAILPDPAIDLPTEATDVVSTFYNLLTVFDHLKAAAEKSKGQDPATSHLLRTMTPQIMRLHRDICNGIMTYSKATDRSRGTRNRWAHSLQEQMKPIITLCSERLQEILGIDGSGSVVLIDFKNDLASQTAVRTQNQARKASLAEREKELLRSLTELAETIEATGIEKTAFFKKMNQWSAEMAEDLTEAMAVTLAIEDKTRERFKERARRALIPAKTHKPTP